MIPTAPSSWLLERAERIPVAAFAPGANPRGVLAEADWRFLLPTLDVDKVLFLGIPSAPELSVLAASARVVVIVTGDPGEAGTVGHAIREQRLQNVHCVCAAGVADLPFVVGWFTLLVARGRPESLRLLRSEDVTAELERLLAPDGLLYLETSGVVDTLLAHGRLVRSSPYGFMPPRRFWLVPRTGRVRAAMPVGDAEIAHYFFDHVLYGLSRKAQLLKKITGYALRLGFLTGSSRVEPCSFSADDRRSHHTAPRLLDSAGTPRGNRSGGLPKWVPRSR